MQRGVLGKYARTVSSASLGCLTDQFDGVEAPEVTPETSQRQAIKMNVMAEDPQNNAPRPKGQSKGVM